jgi:hypothetical protein
MSELSQTRATAAPAPRFSPDTRFSLDTWAVAASVIFIALIVAGIFPRVPW